MHTLRVALAALICVMFGGSVFAETIPEWHDRTLVVRNTTGHMMIGVYASNRDRSTWGPNLLRRSVPSGYEITVNTDDGSGYCIYDLRAKFGDGSTAEHRHINLCDTGTVWTINP